MSDKVYYRDLNFYVNGKPTFLFGGEVHYFRIPKADWEDRILKVKQAGGNLVSFYIPWIIHEDIEGDIDVTGVRRPENDLGTFLSLIQKHDMYAMIRPGPYIMSEIRNEGLPFWIYDKFEDIVALGKDGEKHPSNSVYYLHEGFLECVDKWYAALGSVIKPYMIENGGPVVMAQMDNEIGMMHWCCGQADYSLQNLEDFKVYLNEKYGDKLAEEYAGVDFGAGFVDFMHNPCEKLAAKTRDDFSRYMREYFKRYFEVLTEKFNRYIGNTPVVVNVHGFDAVDIVKRGKRYPIGVSQLSRVADAKDAVMAGDYYIGNIVYDNFQDIMLANAITYAVQPEGQPLFSAEFQGGFQVDNPRMQPPTYDLTTRICVANGMNSVNYYMFAGGTNVKGTDLLGLRHSWQAPVDTDGSLRPHYPVISHLGHIIHTAEESLLTTKQEAVVHFGINPDYYMTEYQDEATKEMCWKLVFYREEALFEGMGKGMSLMNLTYEGYDISRDEPIDPVKMPKMAAFATPYMDPDMQQRLLDYANNGGQLLLFPTIPTMDMKGEPCTILKDALGCDAKVVPWGFVDHIDDVENLIIMETTDFGETDNVFARQEQGFNCGFEKEMGKGKIVAFGVAMAHDYEYRDQVILNVFEKIGVRPNFTTDRIKDKLLLTARVNEDGGRYLFINNIDEYEKTTHIYHNGEALFDGKEFTARSRRGYMLPLNIKVSENVWVKYSTAEIYELKDDCDGVTITLALDQPQDVIVLRSDKKPVESADYTVETLSDGSYRISSNKHGWIENYLTIKLA